MVSMTGEKTKAAIRKVARWRLSVQLLSLLVWLDPLMARCHTVCRRCCIVIRARWPRLPAPSGSSRTFRPFT